MIAEPLPKGVHQAPQTDKELQVCLAARKLLESMGGEYAQVAALPKADFEKRIAAIQEAHSTGRLTKAQAAELIARQRRLFKPRPTMRHPATAKGRRRTKLNASLTRLAPPSR